ncbi:MAG: hypothetical protein M3N93_11800 [Acidobacteriota bacterium]|nr:hypothetical protein [Acidobacteriota bacterium]
MNEPFYKLIHQRTGLFSPFRYILTSVHELKQNLLHRQPWKSYVFTAALLASFAPLLNAQNSLPSSNSIATGQIPVTGDPEVLYMFLLHQHTLVTAPSSTEGGSSSTGYITNAAASLGFNGH